MNKSLRKALSILLTVLIIASTVPFVFANEYVGGIAGNNSGTDTENLNTDGTNAGGIVGSTDNDVTIENAYNSGSTSESITEPSSTVIDGKTFYQLDSADDLYWFAEQVNVYKDFDINAVLTADIVINEDLMNKITIAEDGTATVNEGETVSSWTPVKYFINSDAVGYEGIFDGANHTISGLYVNTADGYMGLFALAKGATIKNVGITDSYFYGDDNIASVVAVARNTTISNCFSSNCRIVNQNSRTGGIAANLIDSNISGCYNTSDIKSLSGTVGGIAGEISGTTTVRDCFNTGDIESKTTSTYHDIGGIVGLINSSFAFVENCCNIGNISSGATDGGIVGGSYGTVVNCYYNSEIFNGSAVGDNSSSVISSEGKTVQQFVSGEVAYTLGSAWGQKIGTDPYPVLGSTDTVYRIATYTKCDMSDAPVCEYNNISGSDINNAPQHVLTGEIICLGELCEVCGKYYGEADESKHSLSWKTAKEATCAEPGLEICDCEVCGNAPAMETVLCNSATYPESEHNYPDRANEEYEFSYPGATKLVITFSEDTETERNYDFIYIYDSTGAEYGKYSGTELAGVQIELEGSSFKIKLTSDVSSNRYGFSLTSVYATAPTAEYQRETVVEHSIQSVSAQPATCTEIGWDAYEYCTACDYTTYAEISALGHSFLNYIKSEDAECEVNAKETASCDNGCGATDTREIEASALEHSFDFTLKSEENLTRPTQNTDGNWNDGYYTYTCLNGCGATDTETVKRADYTAFDKTQVQFNDYVQNYNLTNEAVNAAMQKMMNFVIENGEIEEDLIETEQELIDKAVVLCEEIFTEFDAGIADGTMIKADYTKIDTVIAEIYTALETVTISEEMQTEFADIKAELEALKADVNTSEAEFENSGLLTKAEAIAAAIDNCANGNHVWGEYASNGDATCMADGTKTAYCENVCGESDTVADVGSAFGHTPSGWWAKNETEHWRHCVNDSCSEEIEGTRAEHSYTWEVTVEATATTEGEKVGTCECGATKTEAIPATGEGSTPDEPTDTDCDHLCHCSNTFMHFIWKIFKFFFRLFNIQQYCDCSELHYDNPVFG